MMAANKGMGVIFDLDGVLVDTSKFHKQAWFELAQREGFNISDEIFYTTFGMQNYQIIAKLAGREFPPKEIVRISEWKESRYQQLIADKKLELMKGVKTLLDDLKGKGFLLAIGTSTPLRNLNLMLAQTGTADYFHAYVTDEDVTEGKPAPQTFLKAAEKLALPPKRCVVVEDAAQGVEAGRAAGMAVVAVTTTRSRADLKKADIIVDCLDELKADDFIRLLANPG